MNFHIKPLAKDTWIDFEKLFGPKGACGGCWCMTLRLRSKEYILNKGEGNKRLMYALVTAGEPVGILGYDHEAPVGWCAVAPREQFKRLQNSRIFQPVDDESVWLIGCMYIHKNYRKKGVSIRLIKEATKYAMANGAQIIEAYPHDPAHNMPDVFAYAGMVSAYIKNGFREVARRSEHRPIMMFYRNP